LKISGQARNAGPLFVWPALVAASGRTMKFRAAVSFPTASLPNDVPGSNGLCYSFIEHGAAYHGDRHPCQRRQARWRNEGFQVGRSPAGRYWTVSRLLLGHRSIGLP
jgi:hypothetical protein